MKKNLLRLSLYALTFVITGSIILLQSCKEDDPVPTQTIMEIVDSEEGLDSLSKYLNKYPDLVSLLGAPGDKTFFAPDNDAFLNLLATPGFPQDIESINPEIIQYVLSYHVVADQKTFASELGPDMSTLVTALNSEDVIKVNTDGTLLTGSTNSAIEIKTADIEATNGVVHITNRVLIPQTIGSTLTALLPTVAGPIFLSADFSHLANFIRRADSGASSTADSLIVLLASPTGSPLNPDGITFFAPPNPVFEGAASNAGVSVEQFINSFSPADAKFIIQHHLTGSILKVGDDDYTDGQTIPTMAVIDSTPLELSVAVGTPSQQVPTGITLTSNGGANAPILIGDEDNNGTVGNGIIQVIGGILTPQ